MLLGEVVDVDLGTRALTVDALDRRSELPYDSLIVAAGAQPVVLRPSRVRRDAPGMKTIDDALELRGRIFGAFEMAEHEPDPVARRRWLTFVVVGAGPTGVELAGQLAELSRRSLRRNFRRIDPADARFVLLDAAADDPRRLSRRRCERARRATCARIGIEIHLGTAVTARRRTRSRDELAGSALRRIEAATKIWAAGVEASPLGRLLAERRAPTVDRAGRVKVEPDLTLPGHPEVFVIGDLMSLDGVPGVAQVAIQSGRHAAETIARRLAGDTTRRPFRYRDLGTMATISRFRALAALGRCAAGFGAWLLWLVVHVAALTGFKNRSPASSTGRLPSSAAVAPARDHGPAGLRAARHGRASGDYPTRSNTR